MQISKLCQHLESSHRCAPTLDVHDSSKCHDAASFKPSIPQIFLFVIAIALVMRTLRNHESTMSRELQNGSFNPPHVCIRLLEQLFKLSQTYTTMYAAFFQVTTRVTTRIATCQYVQTFRTTLRHRMVQILYIPLGA